MKWKYQIPHKWENADTRHVWEDVWLMPADPAYSGKSIWITIDAMGDVNNPEHGSERAASQVKALAKLGGLYLQSGDLDKAEQALTQSLAIDPNVPDTEYKLAMTLSKMGKTAESREHMQHFQKLKQTLEAKAKADAQP